MPEKKTLEDMLVKLFDRLVELETKIQTIGTVSSSVTERVKAADTLPALRLTDPVATRQEDGMIVYEYARGTTLVADPKGAFAAGTALCSDGTVRRLTWVSAKALPGEPVPTAVKVGQSTVSGYLTLEPAHKPGDTPALKFLINEKGKYGAALPPGTFKGRRQDDKVAS